MVESKAQFRSNVNDWTSFFLVCSTTRFATTDTQYGLFWLKIKPFNWQKAINQINTTKYAEHCSDYNWVFRKQECVQCRLELHGRAYNLSGESQHVFEFWTRIWSAVPNSSVIATTNLGLMGLGFSRWCINYIVKHFGCSNTTDLGPEPHNVLSQNIVLGSQNGSSAGFTGATKLGNTPTK